MKKKISLIFIIVFAVCFMSGGISIAQTFKELTLEEVNSLKKEKKVAQKKETIVLDIKETAEEGQTKEIKNLQSDMDKVMERMEAIARTIVRHDNILEKYDLEAFASTILQHDDLLKKHDQALNEIQEKISVNISDKPKGMILGRFEKYSSIVSPEIDDSINIIVAGIKKGVYKITENIIVNSDPTGNTEKNLYLSEQRAANLAKRFIAKLGQDNPVPWTPEIKWGNYFKPQGKGEEPFTTKNGDIYRAGKVFLEKPQG